MTAIAKYNEWTNEPTTTNVSVKRAQAAAVSGVRGGPSLSYMNGYHPQAKKMVIYAGKPGHRGLVCHYSPIDFTENYVTEYAEVPIFGPRAMPIQYKFGRPRKWNMRLLFNDLGEDATRVTSGRISTEESIKRLAKFMHPLARRGSSEKGKLGPQTLFVSLIKEIFPCRLATMTIKRLALHPLTRVTTRAEVDVVFIEFVISAT